MDFRNRFFVQVRIVCAACFLFAVTVPTQLAQASTNGTYILAHGNATTTIRPTDPYGNNDWTVDGQTQLFRQNFWYRNGAAGGESPLSNLQLISAIMATPNSLNTVYQSGNNFSIAVNYSLLGGPIGSGSSSIGEQIRINNLTSNPLEFHFFQYVDFDLGGTGVGDTVTLEQNALGLFEKAFQYKGNAFFAYEVVSPAANHGEVGTWGSILTKLEDDLPTTLNDSVGPVSSDTVWAFQWDLVIAPNESFDIAINKSVSTTPVIPEPSTIALISIGLAALGFARRRVGSRN